MLKVFSFFYLYLHFDFSMPYCLNWVIWVGLSTIVSRWNAKATTTKPIRAIHKVMPNNWHCLTSSTALGCSSPTSQVLLPVIVFFIKKTSNHYSRKPIPILKSKPNLFSQNQMLGELKELDYVDLKIYLTCHNRLPCLLFLPEPSQVCLCCSGQPDCPTVSLTHSIYRERTITLPGWWHTTVVSCVTPSKRRREDYYCCMPSSPFLLHIYSPWFLALSFLISLMNTCHWFFTVCTSMLHQCVCPVLLYIHSPYSGTVIPSIF